MQYGTRLNFKFNGAKLHDLRTKKGYSQSQLASLLNSGNPDLKVSANTVGKWENGYHNPSFEAMRELSYRFGIKDDYYWKSDNVFKKIEVAETKPIVLDENLKYLESLWVELDDRLKKLEDQIANYTEQVEALNLLVEKYYKECSNSYRYKDNVEDLSKFASNFIIEMVTSLEERNLL